MKLSHRQETELEVLTFFIHPAVKDIQITEEDIRRYFEWSERGKHREAIRLSGYTDGFNVLINCKMWRGVHMHMWEDGVREGSVTYLCLLGMENKNELMPRKVVDFMKGEMFKGDQAEVIETTYQRVLALHSQISV